jgi:hypothetical protein
VNRTLIVARMAPEHQPEVAAVFGASDATDMPHVIGVSRRALFSFHGLYMHLMDFDRAVPDAMATATSLPGFRAVSRELDPYIQAYDPQTWRGPRDAMASCFYSWSSDAGDASRSGEPVRSTGSARGA